MEVARDELLNHKKGRTNMTKKNWTAVDFDNEEQMKDYIRDDLYPLYP